MGERPTCNLNDYEPRVLAGGPSLEKTAAWLSAAHDQTVMHTQHMLEGLGVNIHTQHTVGTPERVVKAWSEFFSVGEQEPRFTTFNTKSTDMVLVQDIHFYSVCAHHMLPFFGTACIAYIPNGVMAGLSKLVRAVNYSSHRPQVQEELTSQIADYLIEKLETKDVAVVLSCHHMCMAMRGVKDSGHKTKTAALRGGFFEDARVRSEFYSLMGNR